MERILANLEVLKCNQTRRSTAQNYMGIWRKFNAFILRLDKRPHSWEERMMLYATQLVSEGAQSQTIKSYKSAIKMILTTDGYEWDDNKVYLSAITKACRVVNDRVLTRLPIQVGLLELILFEIERHYQGDCKRSSQPYSEIMYKSLFCLAYYGIFRIGELTAGSHPARARDVQIGENKNKILVVLYTSKTHGKESHPQEIKITEASAYQPEKGWERNFCPFAFTREYAEIRNVYMDTDEPFCIFQDAQPVMPSHAITVLRKMLKKLNLDEQLYNFHLLRIGRSVDMAKFHYSIEEIK